MRSPHLRLVRSESEIRLVGLASLTHLSLSLLSLDSLLLSNSLSRPIANTNKWQQGHTHHTHTHTHTHSVCVCLPSPSLSFSPALSPFFSLSHSRPVAKNMSIASFFAASSAIPRTYSFKKEKRFLLCEELALGVFILTLTFFFSVLRAMYYI